MLSRFAKHVAIYLGNKRVAHIGSSKFAKVGGGLNPSNPSDASDASENKASLGARNDHWSDFLHHGTRQKIIRYRSFIPFQRPEKIRKNISIAILAKYGIEEEYAYDFFKNNCEHFATLCVYGVPFSTQVDRVKPFCDKINLSKEIKETEEEFVKMSNSEAFEDEINNLENRLKKHKEREKEIKYLEYLREESKSQVVTSDSASSQIDPSIFSLYSSTSSLSSLLSSGFDWPQIIQKKACIPGTIEQIIPLESNPNQVLVINKVLIYAVRLFEYKDNKLVELKRYAKNKVGYVTLEDALAKVERIKAETNESQIVACLEIPPKN